MKKRYKKFDSTKKVHKAVIRKYRMMTKAERIKRLSDRFEEFMECLKN